MNYFKVDYFSALKHCCECSHPLSSDEVGYIVQCSKEIVANTLDANHNGYSTPHCFAHSFTLEQIDILFATLFRCNCCTEHMTNRPFNLYENNTITILGCALPNDECDCECRDHLFDLRRAAQFKLSGEPMPSRIELGSLLDSLQEIDPSMTD